MKARVAIIGKGQVGSALQRGLKRAGYETRAVGRSGDARETAHWAEIVILAVPYGQLGAALSNLGDALDGKVAVDVTNVLGPNHELAVGFTTSGAEELQKKVPRARVVKAFNTVFASHMDSGKAGDLALAALVAADDAEAKQRVLDMARDIGFDAVDAGPLHNARLLEPLGKLNIELGYTLGLGTGIGFALAR